MDGGDLLSGLVRALVKPLTGSLGERLYDLSLGLIYRAEWRIAQFRVERARFPSHLQPIGDGASVICKLQTDDLVKVRHTCPHPGLRRGRRQRRRSCAGRGDAGLCRPVGNGSRALFVSLHTGRGAGDGDDDETE
jgi:hypothetical protein